MKKLLVALLLLPSLAGAAWVSTNGSTVTATMEDGVGNKLTSTANALDVNLKSGVTTVTGSTVTLQGSGGAGITSTAGALDMNIKSGSIGNTGFNVNNNVTLNALPTGTNNIGTVSGSTTSLQSGGVAITATSGALDMNIKSGSIANTAFTANAGTNLNTSALALETGGNLATLAGGVSASVYQANVKQINGVTPLMGNGTTGTGSQRVTIASDNTAFSVLVGTVTVIPPIGTQQPVAGALAHDGVAAGTNREGTLPAIAQTTFANGTALTSGRNEALSVGTDGLLWVGAHPPMSPASYYATTSSASYASTTDLACMPGNATNTVIVRKITVSCTQTTAGIVTVSLLRRSSADSGGTSAAMKVGKDDSTSGSAVSVPLVYSAAPTKGTLDTMVDSVALGCMATGTASANDIQVWNFNDKAKVLRGTAQEFCLSLATPQDLAGTTVTGGNFNVHFAWDEISTITP